MRQTLTVPSAGSVRNRTGSSGQAERRAADEHENSLLQCKQVRIVMEGGTRCRQPGGPAGAKQAVCKQFGLLFQ